MNIRSLTRGDGAVIGAAVLLLIASFLDFYSVSDCGNLCGQVQMPSGWKSEIFPVLPSVFLAGLIAAVLIVAARLLPQNRRVAGLTLDQWGTALAVFAAWSALWSLMGGGSQLSPGAGAILGLVATLVLAAAAIATPRVPALKAALLGAPKPQQAFPGQQPFAPGPGQPGGGYGYPGQPHGYGAQPQQPGAPIGGVQPAPAAAQGHQAAAAQPQQAAHAQDFAPFWFAVPVARPLYPEDGSPTPLAELTPGTWYLAVDQRGSALVAQTQDGRRGVLQDTTGIQRG
ncbi:DUF5336 domain-containing protein [Streptomyces sp. ICBB 8177]|uniref:DUF5336 domain-containing protein n=1 Tax=Streptomyces sp. ICBB 8177 TaxID=563922 RepID=UPI000D674FC0|nr:DUF5336 domain-containing protein [Streptomyces sp. ICBB 8177]PWI43234.1 hypothetical protein CK485_13740 [Streptomyces sp. ICBB 8177]